MIEKNSSLLVGIQNQAFLDGRVQNFRRLFCVNGHEKIERVDYFQKICNSMELYTVWVVLNLSVDEVWSSKHVGLSNILYQDKLKVYVYLTLPVVFEPDKGCTTWDQLAVFLMVLFSNHYNGLIFSL